MQAPPSLRPRDRGFTVIELAMIIAVTLLIGALGVSAVRTYVARAQIAASVTLATRIQNQVARAFHSTGQPPADRQAAGLSPNGGDDRGEYVDAIDVVDGRIELRFGGTADPAIAGTVLSLTPFETAEQQVVWLCGNELPRVGLKPLGFAGGARQAVQVLTTIEARYLPPTCR
jgi:type IV pilus assembly protein PilA